MDKQDCIFCKIAKMEVTAQITHEDEYSLGFLDIHPAAPGHTLIIPKEHHQWFTDMPDDLSQKIFSAAKKHAEKLKGEYKADYIRLGIVGTDVPHVHIHLLPQNFNSPKLNNI